MAKLMQYQGYYGSAEPSPEDGCIYGKLEFISALVSYEANTVPRLVKAFHSAVDDYLATCDWASTCIAMVRFLQKSPDSPIPLLRS